MFEKIKMSKQIHIWKVSSLLLLGLIVFLYIVTSTAADVYFLLNDPVAGITYDTSPGTREVFISYVVPKGPADEVGLRKGDVIVKFNGRDITNEDQLQRSYGEIGVGDMVDIVVHRGGRPLEFSFTTKSRIKVYTASFLGSLLPGVVFCYTLLLIGIFVLLKKPEDGTAHIFFLMVLFWALAMWGNFPHGSNAILKILPPWFQWVAMSYLPIAVGLLLHFTLIFPFKAKEYKKYRPAWLFFAYGSLILLLVFIYADVNHLPWGMKMIRLGWGLWFSLEFFAAMYLLGRSCRCAPNPNNAEQARIMFRSTAYALALPIGLYFIPRNLFNYVIPYSENLLFLVVIWPISLAYAIIKHRFMDVNFILKRSAAFALISGFVVAAYFLLVVGLGKLVLFLTGSSSQIVTIVATLLIAALFNPVKDRIQRFVETRFYPSRFSYREAVRRFNHQLVNVVDLDKLLELVSDFFVKEVAVSPVVIFTLSPDGQTFVPRRTSGVFVPEGFHLEREHTVLMQLAENRRLLDFSEQKNKLNLRPDELQKWQLLKTELLLPLLNRTQLMGFVSIGPKNNAEAFFKEDIELLDMLTDQVNISLENALLTEELREQDRLKKELEVARKIQLSSLPQSDPDVPGLDVSGISIPAMEVGGDYYDYLTMPDGCFGVVVGDVSGKGTSAALYMSQLKGILQTAAKFYASLPDLMAEVNSIAFKNIEEQSFITLTCGAFDVKKRVFRFVRAGHLPLLYYSGKEGVCREIVPNGIGIGLEDNGLFKKELQEVQFSFHPGDVFVFYSDGIVEARNADNEEFNLEHLTRVIAQNGHDSAFSLRQAILQQVQQFAGRQTQTDDMTLVVVKAK